MGPKIRDWLRAMNGADARRIVLRNLAFDIVNQRVDRSILRAFFEYIEEYWPLTKPRPSAEVMVKRFARTEPPRRVCCGVPRPQDVAYCSRVMDARALFHFHIWPESAGTTIEYEVSTDEIERITLFGVGPAARGELRSELPMAWVTQTDEVTKLREEYGAIKNSDDAFATMLRDALGLYHLIRNEELVEVVYPENRTQGFRLAPPTFLEGLDLVFQSADGGGGWGRTLPLAGDVSLPEAVHEPIPFGGTFTVRMVGRPYATRVNFDWGIVAGTADLLPELERLIDDILERDE